VTNSFMKKTALLLFYFVHTFLQAQISTSPNSSEILLAIKKLNTVGSVLYVAAHPDDENTRLLSYLSKEKNLRTGYISITRGDGGQNLIGKEQGEALGLIRTQELLAARRTDGAEQFFTRANDFGYSKNPEETFLIWNKDSVLSDLVLCIRKFKPDVIICRFPTSGEGGHGHHTASAILALEAFDAAADSTKFKEQLSYTKVWKSKRIFWNTFNFGSTNTTAPDQLKIDVGVFNPLLGKSYGEIAAESRSMHKSQGFGSARSRGENIEYFKLLKGETVTKDLFEGIELNWNRFPSTAKFQKMIDDILKNFVATTPEKSVPALINIFKQLQSINSKDPNITFWKEQKIKECENLILACSGIWAEAIANEYSAVPGSVISFSAQIIARQTGIVKLNGISFFNQSDTSTNLILKTNQLFTFKRKEKINEQVPYSNPYWLNESHDNGLFIVSQKQLIGKAENDASLKVYFNINIQGLDLKIERNLVYKTTDPVKGEVYRPLEILPPVTINISDKLFAFSSTKTKNINFIIKANAPEQQGRLIAEVTEGWSVQIKNPDFILKNKGDEIIIEAILTPGEKSSEGILKASISINGKNYNKSIKRIEYDHIPYQFILSDAEAKLLNMSLNLKETDIGYIPGAGDEVMNCLTQIGYNVTVLTDEIISKEDLSKYKAIVTGIRAYNTNERLQIHYNKLMTYVQNGGNLIVQYNTNSRIGPVGSKLGPFPFTISRERVTNENAEVRFTKPQHMVLNYPNIISQKDFENWIQERGIYFASDIDKNYETVLSINDPNEKQNEGSLIIGKFGKGNFVYSGLAFFRQLPAGVPGAYRLFVNLMSLPNNK